MIPVFISILFGVSLGALAYVIASAILSGAEVYSKEYSQFTSHEFEDVFLFIPPRRIAEAGWAAAAAAFLLVFLLTGDVSSATGAIVGLLLGLVAGAFALQSPRWFLAFLKRRRLHKFNLQLVDTLIGMSNALKAGFSITQACESVVKEGENPIAQEFDMFLQQTRVGVSFSDALSNLERRVGSDDMTLVASAIETARKTGGNLTEILEKISQTIRERMRIEMRIRTLTAQGRLQGIIVGVMPLVIGAAMIIIDPRLMLPFLHSMFGLLAIVGVVLLVGAGGLVIRKIVNIDV
jgi:tight adherence protein B